MLLKKMAELARSKRGMQVSWHPEQGPSSVEADLDIVVGRRGFDHCPSRQFFTPTSTRNTTVWQFGK
jgi:hypothetical protein